MISVTHSYCFRKSEKYTEASHRPLASAFALFTSFFEVIDLPTLKGPICTKLMAPCSPPPSYCFEQVLSLQNFPGSEILAHLHQHASFVHTVGVVCTVSDFFYEADWLARFSKQPGTGAESPTQNNFPATKPKKGNRTDEPKVKGSSESQAHQPVSSDGSVPQAQNDDKPETVPVEEQTTQGNVSPAKVDPVSEMPPVVSQKQSDADARSVTHNNLSVTKPENDSTSQQSGIRRSNKADSDLSPVKGEEHDTASSLKPVDPIISANADNVSPNDRNLKSFDRAEADDGDCVAQDFSQAVATNGMPKNTDKATAHADVHSDNPLPSTHSEGDHLQEAGMHNTSPPSKQACEDELDVGLGLPVASDEV
ncbi:unnamed protein product, partial [Dibothriocephalus latus]